MILVINPGSSSLKYKLFDDSFKELRFSNIEVPSSGIKNHAMACAKMICDISDDLPSVKFIGIRVVHGGNYDKPVLITKSVLSQINKLKNLAPLHNPPAISVIKTIKRSLSKIPFYAVCDTSFYTDLPVSSATYALPYNIARKLEIRRYGFHGISHKYVCDLVDPKLENRVISIHLGGGCSITAINKGNVIDTSMGFTPDEGLVMHTRSGDLDPGLVLFLVKRFGYKKAKNIIEKESGLKGFTNGGMLTTLYLAEEKVEEPDFHCKTARTPENKKLAQLALEIYVVKIKKYIGAYATLMGGVDIISFTGNVGSGSSVIREKIMEGLGFLRYTKTEVIKTNEELAIAQEIYGVINGKQ